EITFLNVQDVLLIHADTIRYEGGLDGLRDGGLLESAVAMPRQRFDGSYLHRDLPAMASAYLYHLCMNHVFLDGNKRVASFSCILFLRANGIEKLPDPDALTHVTLRVASGQMIKSDLTDWLCEAIGG
ncbi:MAG: type II toxin-antitoxin system death-on-curing family toxin, partial [Planctomycetota bacterium]